MNWKWNAPVRTGFRVAAGVVGIAEITMGTLMILVRSDMATAYVFDSSARAGVALLAFGILFLVVAIRGRFVKRDIG